MLSSMLSVSESLPNITGYFSAQVSYTSGFVYGAYNQKGQGYWGGIDNSPYYHTYFNASLSSPAYQDGAKVRPDSTSTCYYIKYA